MTFDTLVRGGIVVDGSGEQAMDIAIASGKIAALLTPGTPAEATTVLDAKGRRIFPGLIDTHVHYGFGEPITEYSTETVYAAQGGFTTILAYFLNNEPYGEVFAREMAYAEPRSHVDYGFHFCTANEAHITELPSYVQDYGVTSFKYFMNFKGEEGRYLGLDGTDDGYLYALLQKAAEIGDVTIVLHTENIELVNRFRREAIAAGKDTLYDWNHVKPPITEAEACVRAMMFAEHLGAKIYIPHLSTRMALDEVRRWRERYDNIWVETCPHYLTHTEDSKLGGRGKANPPFRSKDDVEAMWEGLADGSIDIVASDHCPRKKATKDKPLWQASQGFPGTATILPVLMDLGYHKGRLSMERITELLCSTPAEIFGLESKGRIAVGADADLTFVDPDYSREVKPEELGSYSDYSLYEGWTFKGWPVGTMVRGVMVMQDGQIVGPAGHGRYLRREADRQIHGRSVR